MDRKNTIIKTSIFLLCIFTNLTQSIVFGIPNFQFRKYQVNDGLSENTITCIKQDRKGFLWLGTKDGLNKFDGSNFKVYHHIDSIRSSIGNNYIKSIIEAPDNKMYIGTDGGVYIMDTLEESFVRLETLLGVVDRIITSVTSLMYEENGLLWITTMKEGVYVFDTQKIELSRVRSREADLTQTHSWCVHKDKSGTIWVGCRFGLFRYNIDKNTLEAVEGIIDLGNNSNKEILSIFEDEKGNLWLGTWSDGILFYNKQEHGAVSYCNKNDLNHYITHIRSFLQYDESRLLVGADDGLFLFDIKSNRSIRVDIPYSRYSLSDQNVYCMLRDHEQGIWIGTYFGGLNYLNTSTVKIENYLSNDKPGSLSGKAISQFCEDRSGNLWIATEDGGVNYFDTKTKKFSQPIKTSYHNIHPLQMIGDDLWIGTFSRGIDIYNTKTGKLHNYKMNPDNHSSLDDDCVFSLYQTKKGDIYVGTTMGLNKYNPDQRNFTRIKSDSISFVYDIKEDSYNNLWVASYSDKGISRYNYQTKKWIHYNSIMTEGDPIVNAKLTGIYVDMQKRLWLLSEGRGIFLYDYKTDSFLNISEKNGLPNNVIYGLLDDAFGNIWVSCNRGLVLFSVQEMKTIRVFTQDDGLQSNEFNYKSSYKAKDGKFYFGGINGFNSFYPQDLSSNVNDVIPQIQITSLHLLGSESEDLQKRISYNLNNDRKIELDHTNSSFTISYKSLSYVAQSQNNYAYKLEGIDNDWNYVGNTTSVTYLNLSPGKYAFRVKGSNNQGTWNETGDLLRFEIHPPFWLSNPAKITYFIILILLLQVFYHFLSAKMKLKRLRQLEDYKSEQESLAIKSKIDFFTNIAHEIRTPVSLIKAPLEEIIISGDGSKDTKLNLSIIEKNSKRLNVLIDQLLDFRKMDVTQHTVYPVQINLNQHLNDLYERFLKTAQSQDIDFTIELPEKNIFVISDEDAITKIIGNFLTNALKHTKNRIALFLSEYDEAGLVSIAVTDNGNGILPEFKNRIFDPFYQIQSSENSIGTGIGLFLAKHLSDVLGGKIEIKDNPAGGSVFNFTFGNLELTQSETIAVSHETETEAAPDEMTKKERKSVLVTDDNRDMLSFIENGLKAYYDIDCAENANIAISLIEKKSYDLIISDIIMPGIDGLTFTKHIRENMNYSHIPIILLSAKTDNNTKIDGLNMGADVFIEKPFSLSFLKAQIQSLLVNRKVILEVFNQSPLSSYSVLTNNNNDQKFINRLNEEIDRNIADSDFSIESLADSLYISRSNFQRKLRSICDHSPGEYLRIYRLKKAAQLLLEDELRVNEVAFEVGFSSASYFTKSFVKQFGILPKDFVKQNQKHPEAEAVS